MNAVERLGQRLADTAFSVLYLPLGIKRQRDGEDIMYTWFENGRRRIDRVNPDGQTTVTYPNDDELFTQ